MEAVRLKTLPCSDEPFDEIGKASMPSQEGLEKKRKRESSDATGEDLTPSQRNSKKEENDCYKNGADDGSKPQYCSSGDEMVNADDEEEDAETQSGPSNDEMTVEGGRHEDEEFTLRYLEFIDDLKLGEEELEQSPEEIYEGRHAKWERKYECLPKNYKLYSIEEAISRAKTVRALQVFPDFVQELINTIEFNVQERLPSGKSSAWIRSDREFIKHIRQIVHEKYNLMTYRLLEMSLWICIPFMNHSRFPLDASDREMLMGHLFEFRDRELFDAVEWWHDVAYKLPFDDCSEFIKKFANEKDINGGPEQLRPMKDRAIQHLKFLDSINMVVGEDPLEFFERNRLKWKTEYPLLPDYLIVRALEERYKWLEMFRDAKCCLEILKCLVDENLVLEDKDIENYLQKFKENSHFHGVPEHKIRATLNEYEESRRSAHGIEELKAVMDELISSFEYKYSRACQWKKWYLRLIEPTDPVYSRALEALNIGPI